MKFDCVEELADGLAEAREKLADGQIIVLPTDTVYGVAAHAFDASGVQRLLQAKGRDRRMPPPVLIADVGTIDALAIDVPSWLREMLKQLWPGPLTVILKAQPSLQWDLGETHGTVALRVPADERALKLLREVGPLAVSSANKSGEPPATTIADAESMLGESVSIYFDGGPTSSDEVSTILDVTASTPRILRRGAIGLSTLHSFNNTIEDIDDSGEHG